RPVAPHRRPVRSQRECRSVDTAVRVERELQQIAAADGSVWKRAGARELELDLLPSVHPQPREARERPARYAMIRGVLRRLEPIRGQIHRTDQLLVPGNGEP